MAGQQVVFNCTFHGVKFDDPYFAQVRQMVVDLVHQVDVPNETWYCETGPGNGHFKNYSLEASL